MRQPLLSEVNGVWEIAPMTARDIPSLAEIERACFAHPWSETALAEELSNAAAVFLTARAADGTVGGYVGMLTAGDEGAIANVAVSPAWRRRGCADALLTALLTHAARRELSRLTLEVRVSNTAARALYEKHGFAVVGMRPRFYRTPTEDACIMSCILKG